MKMDMSLWARGLTVVALSLGLSAGAADVTIRVTTTADEDGSNSSRCSLREAVKAVNTAKSYGGCPAGDRVYDNLIQLDAGTYTLNSELEIKAEVVIAGADTARPDDINPLTGRKPTQVRPDDPTEGTFIVGAAGQRIFLVNGQTTLRDMKLQRPATDTPVNGNGGLIYANQTMTLDNVILQGGRVAGTTAAAGNGGAIFLGRNDTSLSMVDVTLRDNVATNKGGAVAMSCSVDLVSYASHRLTFIRSLLRDNQSDLGAGAIEVCGSTTMVLTSSTLSGNITPTAAAGAITYVQTPGLGVGQVQLAQVTAAEQSGHVLSLQGMESVIIDGSFLGLQTNGATTCYPASTIVSESDPTGDFNVFGDGSCSGLVVQAGGDNAVLPGTATFADVFEDIDLGVQGLTNYYLPVKAAAAVDDLLVDKGDEFSSCKALDQRAMPREIGTACDVGAVERLQLYAADDEADSVVETDRTGVVDILENDSFAETASGPVGHPANTVSDPTVLVKSQSGGTCSWKFSNDEENPDKLVVTSTDGVPTEDDSPVVCTYVLVEKATGTESNIATVEVHVKNQNPLARDDRYVRPQGTESISFNPLTNDDDDGDGKYGRIDDDPNKAPAWEEFYPIEITGDPELGTVIGSGPSPSGLCPGSSSEPRMCLAPPLKYIARNNLSPFADTFNYRVYDADGAPSNSATVTVATDAPEPGTGGGSADLAGLGLLALLGLRRRLKL